MVDFVNSNNNDLFGNLPSANRKTLSHYTSLDGFIGIIGDSQIRASNILFLNDRQEMSYGLDIARDVVEEINKNTKRKQPEAARLRFPSTKQIPDTYACCFCEEPDMLSQWRGYGSNTQSVSIQFDMDRLKQLALALGFSLTPIIYGRKNAMDIVRKRLGDDASLWVNFIRDILEMDTDAVLHETVFDLAPQFKNHHFLEEREWRIIVKARASKEVSWRVRDNVIMPYVSIGSPNGLPITRVLVGPGKDAELTRRSVESYLKMQPLYKDVEVAVSQIPFRT